VDIVTADGEFLTASASEHADLFWGVRGGGGNFGVVTSFEYQLHPVGKLLAGMVVYPRHIARDLLRFHRDFLKAAPDELNTVVALTNTSDGVPVIAVAVCYNGDLATGERVLQPLREFGSPLADEIKPMSYHEVQTMLDSASPPGRRNYIKTGFLQSISDDAIDTILERIVSAPSPYTFSYFTQLGNAVARADATATAFSHRDALCEWGCLSVWLDPAEDEANVRWARALAEAMKPFTAGAYVNQMEADEGTESIRAAYGASYERLVGLKGQYDPTNMFRLNPNVRPTT
jgi:FAD/FMN-containing dehydrogenase